MIQSFIHKGLKRFFETGSKAGIQPPHANRLRLILTVLNVAQDIADIDKPGLKLHALKGDRKGDWAVSVSGNWRVTFQFKNGDAYLLNYEDYH